VALPVVLALAVVAVVVVVAVTGRTASPLDRGTGAHREPTDCPGITAKVHSPAATTVPGTGTRVAVLGDSYTSAYGLDSPRDGYAYLLARSLGWNASIDGFPGTGFVADDGCPGERYGERVDRVPPDAQLVLVEGGLNDVTGGAALGPAADAVLSALHARVPAATLVVVGPPLVPAHRADDVRAVAAALSFSAAAHGATYVDTTGWRLPYLVDGVHLPPSGHRLFARLLGTALSDDHLVPAPPSLTP
jgi:acyl-CoA thioesterase-1